MNDDERRGIEMAIEVLERFRTEHRVVKPEKRSQFNVYDLDRYWKAAVKLATNDVRALLGAEMMDTWPCELRDGDRGSQCYSLCKADRDGECTDKKCPQLRDNEPYQTGRHCPLDFVCRLHGALLAGEGT